MYERDSEENPQHEAALTPTSLPSTSRRPPTASRSLVPHQLSHDTVHYHRHHHPQAPGRLIRSSDTGLPERRVRNGMWSACDTANNCYPVLISAVGCEVCALARGLGWDKEDGEGRWRSGRAVGVHSGGCPLLNP